MHTTMLLCDAAQVSGGKLHILGGGWNQAYSSNGHTSPSALAIIVEIPWDRLGEQFDWHLTLCDADGAVVTAPGSDAALVVIRGAITTGRPENLTAGVAATQLVAVGFPSLQLDDGRYEWRLTVDGEPSGSCAFEVIRRDSVT